VSGGTARGDEGEQITRLEAPADLKGFTKGWWWCENFCEA